MLRLFIFSTIIYIYIFIFRIMQIHIIIYKKNIKKKYNNSNPKK